MGPLSAVVDSRDVAAMREVGRVDGLIGEYIPPVQDEAPLITMSHPGRPGAVDMAASGSDRPPFRVRDHPRWGAALLGIVVLGVALLAIHVWHRRDVSEERASALAFTSQHRAFYSEGVAHRAQGDIYTVTFDLHDNQDRDFLLLALSFQGVPIPFSDAVPGPTTRQLIKLQLPGGCAAVGQLPPQLILKVTAQRPGHRQIATQVHVDIADVRRSAQMDCDSTHG